MACTLINVKPTVTCEENFSGTGNKAYIARLNDTQRQSLTYVGLDDDGKTPIRMTIPSDILKTIQFIEVVLKSKVNKVDYQSNANGGGYIATAQIVVDKQVDSWAYNSRIMNNTGDWIVLLADGKGAYYFLGDANFDNEFSDAGSTGDAPDSDKGSTVTITAGPLKAEYLKIDGKMEAAQTEEGADAGYFTLNPGV